MTECEICCDAHDFDEICSTCRFRNEYIKVNKNLEAFPNDNFAKAMIITGLRMMANKEFSLKNKENKEE